MLCALLCAVSRPCGVGVCPCRLCAPVCCAPVCCALLCAVMQAVKIPCSAVSWSVRLYTAFSRCNLFIIPLLVSCPCRASLCAMPLPWPMSVSCVCGLWPVAASCAPVCCALVCCALVCVLCYCRALCSGRVLCLWPCAVSPYPVRISARCLWFSRLRFRFINPISV